MNYVKAALIGALIAAAWRQLFANPLITGDTNCSYFLIGGAVATLIYVAMFRKEVGGLLMLGGIAVAAVAGLGLWTGTYPETMYWWGIGGGLAALAFGRALTNDGTAEAASRSSSGGKPLTAPRPPPKEPRMVDCIVCEWDGMVTVAADTNGGTKRVTCLHCNGSKKVKEGHVFV